LLQKLLVFNPLKRFTVQQALEHPYVQDFRSLEEEIVIEKPIEVYMDDNKKFTIKEYRDALYNEISKKKKE
jgi:mitogen-activated protein kinase 15